MKKKKPEKKKLKKDNILTGVAGEYLVAGELSRRGYIASITLRNTRGIDILVSNRNATKSVGIQVKSTKYGDARAWMLNEKAENYYAENLFYVFVNLKDNNQRPDFFIVPSKIVAKYIKKFHKAWLKIPNRKGGKHQNTTMRKFSDAKDLYLEKWESLNL